MNYWSKTHMNCISESCRSSSPDISRTCQQINTSNWISKNHRIGIGYLSRERMISEGARHCTFHLPPRLNGSNEGIVWSGAALAVGYGVFTTKIIWNDHARTQVLVNFHKRWLDPWACKALIWKDGGLQISLSIGKH